MVGGERILCFEPITGMLWADVYDNINIEPKEGKKVIKLGTEKFEAMVFLMCSTDVQYGALKRALSRSKLVGCDKYLTLL